MAKRNVNGVTFSYSESGRGNALVLVHGLACEQRGVNRFQLTQEQPQTVSIDDHVVRDHQHALTVGPGGRRGDDVAARWRGDAGQRNIPKRPRAAGGAGPTGTARGPTAICGPPRRA